MKKFFKGIKPSTYLHIGLLAILFLFLVLPLIIMLFKTSGSDFSYVFNHNKLGGAILNQKTGTHLLWDNKKLIRMNNDHFDLACFKNTILQMQKKSKIKMTYWAYIFQLTTDGILGTDKRGISVDTFIEEMKELNIAGRNTFYDYKPRGSYPNYLPSSKDMKKYEKEVVNIKTFVMQFVEKYFINLNIQVPLEDIDTIF